MNTEPARSALVENIVLRALEPFRPMVRRLPAHSRSRLQRALSYFLKAPGPRARVNNGQTLSESESDLMLAMRHEFDAEWYILEYPDVCAAAVDPVQHYIHFGSNEGRYPNPTSARLKFDATWYLETYSDVRASGVPPLHHYLHFGLAEGRFCNAFDGDQSSRSLSDLCNPEGSEPHLGISDAGFLVSVLTPTYNTEPRYLRELFQTLVN
ncbi:MAG TPA: hypothetical protein VGC77_10280, partial [Rhodopseudomonas sp.]